MNWYINSKIEEIRVMLLLHLSMDLCCEAIDQGVYFIEYNAGNILFAPKPKCILSYYAPL